ncbi:MAG: hypothetical protein AAGI52_13085 [Bacteroidota bacterium]
MTRSFRFAPLALFFVAAPALAQSPVFEVRDATGATLLFAVNADSTITCTNCVTTEALADTSVTPAKVAGGLFNSLSKSQVYTRSATPSLVGSRTTSFTVASCDVPEDIPLTGGCRVTSLGASRIFLRGAYQRNWDSLTEPAEYRCEYALTESSLQAAARAEITCLDVSAVAAGTASRAD